MKFLLVFALLCTSALGFAQNTGIIVGKITDEEVANAPLVLANINIKGTKIETNTDQTGLFALENLEAGNYVLVCSFLGYKNKEINVHVDALTPLEINIALTANTISLTDLAAITSIVQKEEATTKVLN
ncbi:MAG: carboxypeptidase-like regulatory domain-containing protein [Flavobacteriaceae bacterium]